MCLLSKSEIEYLNFQDLQMFSLRMLEVRKVIHISSEARKVLWELCTFCASLLFVEG